MTDVLLIVPPFNFSALNSAARKGGAGGYYLYYPPLGLCSIGACLKARGFSVRIVDCFIERVDARKIAAVAAACRPKIVGVSVTTPSLPAARDFVRALRGHRDASGAGFIIVAGGPHVSCDPGIVASLGADAGIAGDGEPGMTALAKGVPREDGAAPDWTRAMDPAPGLVTPDNGSVKTSPPAAVESMGAVPFPDRSLVAGNPYFNPYFPSRTTTFLSARGCPFRCAFCSRTGSMGSYRPRPVEDFLREAEAIRRDGYGFVSVIDETFTYDRARAAALAEGLLDAGGAGARNRRRAPFRWSCQTRADMVDRDVLDALRRAGCVNVSFGVEAGDAAVRRGLDKDISYERLRDAFRLCREAGVTTNAFMMIGNPSETEGDVERGIDFVMSLSPDYAVFNIATLLPGSVLYEEKLAKGTLTRGIWDEYMRGERGLPVLSEALSRETLAAHLRRGFLRFYARPGAILRSLWRMRSPRRLALMMRLARTVILDYIVG
ncbi:MAG: radical SAM protein [bacterium]